MERMPPYELDVPGLVGRQFVKKGRLHSEKALQLRAEQWLSKWKSILRLKTLAMQEVALPDDNFKTILENGDYSNPLCVKGFDKLMVEKCVNAYGMLEEKNEVLQMEQNFSTDEDEDVPDEEIDVGPITLNWNVKFSKDKLRNCGYDSDYADEQSNVESGAEEEDEGHHMYCNWECDSESGPPRPISRISIVVPGFDDGEEDDQPTTRPLSSLSRSGYSTFSENEDGDDFDAAIDSINPSDITFDTSFCRKGSISKKEMFGNIPGISVGSLFNNRQQLSRRSVHCPKKATIHGGPNGAFSIILSADHGVTDRGDEFYFYGEGGRDKSKKHVADQKMKRGNLSLSLNLHTGNPVRVIRGHHLNNEYAPEYGYRYDGLYSVTQIAENKKIDGFKAFVFTFVRCPHQAPPPWRSTVGLPLPWQSQQPSDEEEQLEIERSSKPKNRMEKEASVIQYPVREPSGIRYDATPPDLLLPDKAKENCIVYPTPPLLTPSLFINTGLIDVHKRPVVILKKLDANILISAIKGPVRVSRNKHCLDINPQRKKRRILEVDQSSVMPVKMPIEEHSIVKQGKQLKREKAKTTARNIHRAIQSKPAIKRIVKEKKPKVQMPKKQQIITKKILHDSKNVIHKLNKKIVVNKIRGHANKVSEVKKKKIPYRRKGKSNRTKKRSPVTNGKISMGEAPKLKGVRHQKKKPVIKISQPLNDKSGSKVVQNSLHSNVHETSKFVQNENRAKKRSPVANEKISMDEAPKRKGVRHPKKKPVIEISQPLNDKSGSKDVENSFHSNVQETIKFVQNENRTKKRSPVANGKISIDEAPKQKGVRHSKKKPVIEISPPLNDKSGSKDVENSLHSNVHETNKFVQNETTGEQLLDKTKLTDEQLKVKTEKRSGKHSSFPKDNQTVQSDHSEIADQCIIEPSVVLPDKPDAGTVTSIKDSIKRRGRPKVKPVNQRDTDESRRNKRIRK